MLSATGLGGKIESFFFFFVCVKVDFYLGFHAGAQMIRCLLLPEFFNDSSLQLGFPWAF